MLEVKKMFSKKSSALLIFLITCVSLLDAQNYSGLQNRDLTLASNPGLASATMFPEVTGTVQRVFVRFDSESQLKLVMQYTGFENAFIKAETMDHNMKVQKEIQQVSGNLQRISSPIELVFNLKGNVAPDRSVRSRYVRITFSSRPNIIGPNTPQVVYTLHKAWLGGRQMASGNMGERTGGNSQHVTANRHDNNRQPLTNNNVIVKVRLEPVGSAVDLSHTFVSTPQKRPGGTGDRNKVIKQSLVNESDSAQTTPHNEPLGPGKYKISLWEDLRSDVEFKFSDVSGISLDLYQDSNPASKHYYYVPAAYNLLWDQGKGIHGFDLKTLYGSASGQGEAGEVRIHARVSPGINTGEVNFIKALLDAYVQRNFDQTDVKLKILPVDGPPKVSFSDELRSLYNIPSERVSVNVASDIAKAMNVSWATDSKTKDEMVIALMENVGINGSMMLSPMGDSLSPVRIPVHININDAQTFGRFVLDPGNWRRQHWRNTTPYPVTLKYLHALMVKEDETGQPVPFIYSWKLGQKVIASGAKAFFDAKKMPRWIDKVKNTKRIWLDYTVMPCDGCNKSAINATLGGTSGDMTRKITFELFDVMDQTGAKLMQIRVRSRQADPKGNTVVEINPAIRITADNAYTTGPLYVEAGENPDFEYHLTLVMPDGTKHEATEWIRAREPEVFLGMKNLKEALPTLIN